MTLSREMESAIHRSDENSLHGPGSNGYTRSTRAESEQLPLKKLFAAILLYSTFLAEALSLTHEGINSQ